MRFSIGSETVRSSIGKLGNRELKIETAGVARASFSPDAPRLYPHRIASRVRDRGSADRAADTCRPRLPGQGSCDEVHAKPAGTRHSAESLPGREQRNPANAE